MTPRSPARFRSPRALRFRDAISEQRWDSMDEQDMLAAIAAEPLRFVADHLDGADRRPDCAAVYIRSGDGHDLVAVITDLPEGADGFDAAEALRPFATVAAGHEGAAIGVVLHEIEPSPRSAAAEWATVVVHLAEEFGLQPLGVAVRYADGVLVPLPLLE